MEAKAVWRLCGASVPCSSTKHLTGHTLGAAGATEAALAWLMLTRGLMLPAQRLTPEQRDATLAPIDLLLALIERRSPSPVMRVTATPQLVERASTAAPRKRKG